ncbi:hypothetical protein [Rouxiella sp. Mn2063]|uniref:hypothetical protein n=1 Tax=Rouxiella sp. Mn2063 TaxID=3395262 RepID=UPI003BCDD89F
MSQDTNLNLPQTFLQSAQFRENDVYLPEMNWQQLVGDFYPDNIANLVQGMSNITSAFYGNMLSIVGTRYGVDQINIVSRETIYSLGRATAKRYLAQKEIPQDARGVMNIIIAAIYTANPEYQFEITAYHANHAAFLLGGTDRYHKVAVALGIEKHLTWPAIDVFVQAIHDELKLDYQVKAVFKSLDSDSRCLYEISIGEA